MTQTEAQNQIIGALESWRTVRQVARMLGISRSSVQRQVSRIGRARLVPNWKETTTIVEADGTERSFSHAPSRGLDVSSNSVIEECVPEECVPAVGIPDFRLQQH